MTESLATVECPECDLEFKTSVLKHIGDKFNCSHCGHPMIAESDWGEDGEIIWYAKTDNKLAAAKARGES